MPAKKAAIVAVTRKPVLFAAPTQLSFAAADLARKPNQSTHGIQRTSSQALLDAPGAKRAMNVRKTQATSRNPATIAPAAATTEKTTLLPVPPQLSLTVTICIGCLLFSVYRRERRLSPHPPVLAYRIRRS